MSACTRTPDGRRRRIIVLAGSTTAIAASMPLLLHHAGGPSDVSDAALAGLLSFALGVAVVFLVAALLKARRT